MFEYENDKYEKENLGIKLCGINKLDPHARIGIGLLSNRIFLYDYGVESNLLTIDIKDGTKKFYELGLPIYGITEIDKD